MISSDTSTQAPQHVSTPAHHTSGQTGQSPQELDSSRRKRYRLHSMMWVCLALACVGVSWFSYQYFLVPQSAYFTPQWEGAQWVQATDGNAPVAYFRYVTVLNTVPDEAFVTIAANQVFRLYVNSSLIGSNSLDFAQGKFQQAYIYDIDSLLQPGPNVIALRVSNADQQPPAVRLSLGIVSGTTISYHGTGDGWQATTQSAAVYPRYVRYANSWTTNNFDASSWQPVRKVANLPLSPLLTVNPLLYERPIPSQWVSVGVGHDAYFVRQFSLPSGITGAWLRLAATGTASVFINGSLFLTWDGQPSVPLQNVDDYFNYSDILVQYRAGLKVGVYDISPYLHPGVNTIAVHVAAPGDSAARLGLDTLKAAMTLDTLISDSQGHTTWFPPDHNWHASSQPIEGWEQGSNAALLWPFSISLARPGASRTFYLADSNTPRSVQFIPATLVGEVLLCSIAAVLGLWLLLSLLVMRRYYRSLQEALGTTSIVYLPALACEGLLVALSLEPLIPRPFPYTWVWGLVLMGVVAISCLILWMHARKMRQVDAGDMMADGNRNSFIRMPVNSTTSSNGNSSQSPGQQYLIANSYRKMMPHIFAWLRIHWAVVLLVLLVIPLICYGLTYEPYWQDELTSYYAAKGILAHGLPLLPSGFLYTKAELYSYVLALSIAIFGEQGGALRIVSIVEYLVSLPLLYIVGCYFFNRRIALLATIMLALSPNVLSWGQQVRMYEQAQVLTLLTAYLFHRALQERQHVRFVYLSVGSLILTYLSHEETFIILPAIVLCVLVASRDRTHLLPAVLYQKHWWYAAAIGASVISLQLLIVRVTHPPILGTDQSQRELVQLTTENVPFYIKQLFFPWTVGNGTLPLLTMNSLLATAGCVWAMHHRDSRATYCALFLLIAFLTLVFTFTLATDRYIYPLLPMYYLMGAYALLMGLDALWTFARSRLALRQPERTTQPRSEDSLSRPIRFLATCTLGLVCVAVLVVPVLPISDYNPFISQELGLPYHRHYADYDTVGQYMRQHWQQGDIVIAISPAISILYYVGHVDYFFSLDRALYLFEKNGQITDTPTGSTPLLSQEDFQAVVASHARIWIISDNALYQLDVLKDRRFIFPPDFHMVYEGYQSAIYFRGS